MTDTSRYPSRPSVHGSHGGFLASLAALSLLTVLSHHERHVSTNSVTMRNSEVLTRQLPCPASQRLDHGTRVTVADLFGSMPVRAKQRPSPQDRAVIDKDWSKLICNIVAMLLAWPLATHVYLKNIDTHQDLRLRPSDKADVVSRTLRLLTQASLTDSNNADSWTPVSASSGSIVIKGCICSTPSATRQAQFISLGVRPLVNEFGTDVLYEEINRTFNNSSFGTVDGDEEHSQRPTRSENSTGRELRNRKGIERWPLFYLKITGPGILETDGAEHLNSQASTLAAVVDLVKAICYGYLKKHHFRPRKVQMPPYESVFSTSRSLSRSKRSSKRQTTSSSSSSRVGTVTPVEALDPVGHRVESPFDGWHRIKVGRTATLSGKRAHEDTCVEPRDVFSTRRLVGDGGKLLRKPFDESFPESEETRKETHEETIPFIKDAVFLPGPDNVQRSSLNTQEAPTQTHGHEEEKLKERSQWLRSVIASWENPVFENTEMPIPQIGTTEGTTCKHTHYGGSTNISFDTASMSLSGRVTRRALEEATVLSQVDRKFILVKLPLDVTDAKPRDPGRDKSALIMLDQHAVDERCRLEALMSEYFVQDALTHEVVPVIETLEKPLVFEVTAKEHALLEQHRHHFENWGLIYQTPHSLGNQVVATSLPPSILERCRLEPRLLIELLRKEIWRIAQERAPFARTAAPTKTSLISRFYGCPPAILEMLHSRACRSTHRPRHQVVLY